MFKPILHLLSVLTLTVMLSDLPVKAQSSQNETPALMETAQTNDTTDTNAQAQQEDRDWGWLGLLGLLGLMGLKKSKQNSSKQKTN